MLDHEKKERIQPSILVIDDDEIIRHLFRDILEREGYTVLDAPDGNKGLKQYRENPTDLVITDLIMPNKEGIETIRDLRREFPDIKIIAVSGGGRIGPDSYLQMARNFGALHALTKPIDRKTLLKTVEEVLAFTIPEA